MKVLIADRLSPLCRDELTRAGHQVVVDPSLAGTSLVSELRATRPDVLVVRSTKVTADALDASRELSLVVRAGAGVNTIDLAAANERGVFVANCPGKNAAAVAELAFGLILAADRQIPNNVRDVRQGRWNKKRYSQARGLFGRTLGIIGLGNIGREMVGRASAFGMSVIAWSRSLTPEEAKQLGVTYAESAHDVASRADIVSVHLASTPQTRGLIDEAFVARMAPGTIFVNTSRGDVVDEAALLAGVRQRGIRLGLDVYQSEPASKEDSFACTFRDEELAFGTHHIGASTEQAQEAVAAEVVRIISDFHHTGLPPSAVNLAEKTDAACRLVVRHRDRVGVLATVLDQLSRASINVQEMDNLIFEDGHAAIAHIQLETFPNTDTLDAISAGDDVLGISLVPLT